MDLIPKQPDLPKPPIAAGVVLVALQIVAGILMVALGSLLRVEGGSAFSMVGAMVAALGYAGWAENKTPDSMSRNSMLLWLSGIATVVQLGLALVYAMIVFIAARSDGGVQLPPWWFWLLIITVAGAIFFGVTWIGLWQGRRIMRKQRERASSKS